MLVPQQEVLKQLESFSSISKLETPLPNKCLVFSVDSAGVYVDGTMSVYAYDCAIHVPTLFPWTCSTTAVEFEAFAKALKNVPCDENGFVFLDLAEDGSSLILKGKRTRYSLPILHTLDFDVLNGYDDQNVSKKDIVWNTLYDDFPKAIETVAPFALTKKDGDILGCIHVTVGQVETCDRSQLLRKSVDHPLDVGENVGLLFNAKRLVSLIPFMEQCYRKDSWVWFRKEGVGHAQIRLMDGIYPDLDKIIFKHKYVLCLPKEVLSTLKRAKVLGDEAVTVKVFESKGVWKVRVETEHFREVIVCEDNVFSDGSKVSVEFKCSLERLETLLSLSLDVCMAKQSMLKVVGEDFTYVTVLHQGKAPIIE
jgi:hypothetical protein